MNDRHAEPHLFIPRFAIFDLDGTLIHFEHDFVFAKAEKVLTGLGYAHISREDLELRFAEHRMFDFVPEDERIPFTIKFWNHFKTSENPPARILNGAIETLATLVEHKITIALATARSEMPDEFKQELKALGLLPYVSFISTRDRLDTNWVDKRLQLITLCRQSNLDPANTFMAGDMPDDIRAAHAAKLGFSVALLSGGIKQNVLERESPNVILETVKELPQHLGLFRPE